jgi:hypothetical protein
MGMHGTQRRRHTHTSFEGSEQKNDYNDDPFFHYDLYIHSRFALLLASLLSAFSRLEPPCLIVNLSFVYLSVCMSPHLTFWLLMQT